MIEALVATVVFSVIAVGLFRVWSSINHNQAVSIARGQAKSEVEVAARRLERDISMAKADTIIGNSGEDGLQFEISRTTDTGSVEVLPVNYVRNGKELTRETPREKTVLTKFLKDGAEGFSWAREATASGVIYLTLTVEHPVPGDPDNFQTHSQEFMATVREEAIGAGVDERWKKSDDILENW